MNKFTLLTLVIFNCLVSNPVQAKNYHDLIERGRISIEQGHYYDAESTLKQAAQRAAEQQDAYSQILIQGLQGNLALQTRQIEQAQDIVQQALTAIGNRPWYELKAHLGLNLAKVYLQQGQLENAETAINYAQADAQRAGSPLQRVSGYLLLVGVAHKRQQPDKVWRHLQQAQQLLLQQESAAETVRLWLNLGYQAKARWPEQPSTDYLRLAYSALTQARQLARQHSQHYSEVLAMNYLAELYETKGRQQEALQLNLQAIYQAQQYQYHDVLIDLEWRLGRLYQQQQKLVPAIEAYRRAVSHIETIRIDIPVTYKDGRSSFRETLAPVYTGLSDLLLRQAQRVSPEQQQAILIEARDTIETFKRSELQDFFQSRCELASRPVTLERNNTGTAAVYPILLPDRLEILIYSSNGLKQFVTPITSAEEIDRTARDYAALLRSQAETAELQSYARKFYDWIIRPAAGYLTANNVETLLYIPDGVLRLLPLASLYDGQQYLIENYAIATLPGMILTEAPAADAGQLQMFFVGLSQPGDVVKDLPASLLSELVGFLSTDASGNRSMPERSQKTRDIGRYRSRTLTSDSAINRGEDQQRLRSILQNPDIVSGLQDMLSLPGVEEEIAQLAALNPSTQLINEEFSLDRFVESIEQKPYRVIHVASHGFFGDNAEDSFIMTHDRILNINKLEDLFVSEVFRQQPPDLVTFSACQTAEGNDRSPLGMSGVALKANVQTVLGSLWPIADEATVVFMNDFYQALQQPGLSKAKALQQAQTKLLHKDRYNSPAIWSPYILIGNWR